MRILIVEDSSDVRRALKTALELLIPGCSVADVPSAEEGLLEFHRQPADLLITDMRLPGMTGLELMARMRQKRPEMKLILMTGLPDPEYRSQALAGGASAFFAKPLDIQELAETVRSLFPEKTSVTREETVQPTVADWLLRLRRETGAPVALLINSVGKVTAQAGDTSLFDPDSPLILAAVNLFSSARRIGHLLDGESLEAILGVRGAQYTLYLFPLTTEQALILLTPPAPAGEELSIGYPAVRPLLVGLSNALTSATAARSVPALVEAPEGLPAEALASLPFEPLPVLEVEDEQLDLLLSKGDTGSRQDEVENFWEYAGQAEQDGVSGRAEVLTYDEARRLGLAPDTL